MVFAEISNTVAHPFCHKHKKETLTNENPHSMTIFKKSLFYLTFSMTLGVKSRHVPEIAKAVMITRRTIL